MKKIFYYLWQLPQNLVGLAYLAYTKMRGDYLCASGTTNLPVGDSLKDDDVVVVLKKSLGSVSLGNYVFVSVVAKDYDTTLKHELGHHVQSKLCGLAYLLCIGLPSITWAGLRRLGFFRDKSYYSFYTEKSADKLAGINRG